MPSSDESGKPRTERCARCGGTIRPGSLTAWIFSGDPEQCTCATDQSNASGQASGTSATPPSASGASIGGAANGIWADRYVLQELIGSGSSGSVYAAFDQKFDGRVAVKLLNKNVSNDTNAVKRFQREAEATRALGHPNLMVVHDFGVHEATPYLVMEFVDGDSLAEELRKAGTLSLDRFIRIFTQCCKGLAHAHKNGIVHRDLKPDNIVIQKQPDGSELVKIVDFGIALVRIDTETLTPGLTQTGEIFGTPLYMSPEQCRGERPDHRSDIYSLGCVMYESLIGKPPFRGDNPIQIILKHLNESPDLLFASTAGGANSLGASLKSIVLKCLAKAPADRYQTADQLEKDILAAGIGQVIKQETSSWNKAGASEGKKSTSPALLVAAIAGTIFGFTTGFWLHHNQRDEAPSQVAQSARDQWLTSEISAQRFMDKGQYKEAEEQIQKAISVADKSDLPSEFTVSSAYDELDLARMTNDETAKADAVRRVAAASSQIAAPTWHADEIRALLNDKAKDVVEKSNDADGVLGAFILRAVQLRRAGNLVDAEKLLLACQKVLLSRQAKMMEASADRRAQEGFVRQSLQVAGELRLHGDFVPAEALLTSLVRSWPAGMEPNTPLHVAFLLEATRTFCDAGDGDSSQAGLSAEQGRTLATAVLGSDSRESAMADTLAARASGLRGGGNLPSGQANLVNQAVTKFRNLPTPDDAGEGQALVLAGFIKNDRETLALGLDKLEGMTEKDFPTMFFAIHRAAPMEIDPTVKKALIARADALHRHFDKLTPQE